MAEQMIFKRYEMKYMLNRKQYEKLKILMSEHMKPDKHGKSTNCSLYFDTPSFLLIRRSMEGPLYKEKVRVRSYGVANEDSAVFIELKKKYDQVTYKRRVSMSLRELEDYYNKQNSDKDITRNSLGEKHLQRDNNPADAQILKEIDYCFKNYKGLKPKVLLTYDRFAFYDKKNPDFRMTFDENIRWRDYDLSLSKGIYGEPLLNEDQVLLEIKVSEAIPKWLVDFLTQNNIYKTSFSKYANAYKEMYRRSGGKIIYA